MSASNSIPCEPALDSNGPDDVLLNGIQTFSSPMSSVKPPLQSFEFTKRKKWADTLFSEISEALILIVSPSFKVLYCGAAIVELLGWKEDQLVDVDLRAIINGEDLPNFLWAFTESLRSGQELFTYARFKYEHPPSQNPASSLLFEVKGHPHYLPGDPPSQCFFLCAMPYPTRDIALLNSFLELKVENERLSRYIRSLKQASENSQISELFPATYTSPDQISEAAPMFSANPTAQPFYGQFDGEPGATNDNMRPTGGSINPFGLGSGEDYDEQRRKKFKKMCVGEDQRVCMTCGRTDSPEWRKGPHGPKTLCNACGLRWAKRTRRPEADITFPLNLTAQDRPETETDEASLAFQNFAPHLMFQ